MKERCSCGDPGCGWCGVAQEGAPDHPVESAYGRPLRHWDSGSGRWWLYSETLGPFGVVRADTWEEAYEICMDEIMDGLSLTEVWDEIDGCPTDDDLPEGYGYRPNGEPTSPWCHGEIFSEDLNGCRLEPLTKKAIEVWDLRCLIPLDDDGYELKETHQ